MTARTISVRLGDHHQVSLGPAAGVPSIGRSRRSLRPSKSDTLLALVVTLFWASAVCAKTTQRYIREVGTTENIFGSRPCKEEEHLTAMGARISGDASEAVLLQAVPYDLPRDADPVPDDYAAFRGDSTDPSELNKRIVMYSVCA